MKLNLELVIYKIRMFKFWTLNLKLLPKETKSIVRFIKTLFWNKTETSLDRELKMSKIEFL